MAVSLSAARNRSASRQGNAQAIMSAGSSRATIKPALRYARTSRLASDRTGW